MSFLEKVEESGAKTVGEYFYSLFKQNEKETDWRNPDEPIEPIRNHFVYRNLYEKEFDEIWDHQKKYYPDIFSSENKKIIKDECIFYQRPLKSQKPLLLPIADLN